VITGAESWAPTLLRLGLGVIFVMHGWYAVSVLGLDTAAAFIVRMGYPPPLAPLLAWYLVVVHLAGGVLILLGLWTRLAALLQVPIMASAVFFQHFAQGFFLRVMTVDTPGGPRPIVAGYEYAALVLLATLSLALSGPGALSVDGARATRPHLVVP
jgi:putative oxidoreductase